MKTCPKCHAQVEDDALFCMMCGNKFESSSEKVTEKTKFCTSCGAKIPIEAKFCPECAAKQDIELEQPKVLECPIKRRNVAPKGTIMFYKEPNGELIQIQQLGELRLYKDRAFFTTENTSIFLKLGAFGQNTKFSISFRNVVGVNLRKYNSFGALVLVIIENNGTYYQFGGSGFSRSTCNDDVTKMAYVFELYRRLYWQYDDKSYGEGCYPTLTSYFDDNVVDMNEISFDDLIKEYKRL